MPKKQKAIAGVGVSSIVELRAQLYRTQEEAKRAKDAAPYVELPRAKKKKLLHDLYSNKNSGVEDRAHRDKLKLKATNDGPTSYDVLEKKVELYAKLVRGELLDDDEKEKYCVDFLKKGALEDEFEQLEGNNKGGALDSNRLNEASMLSLDSHRWKVCRYRLSRARTTKEKQAKGTYEAQKPLGATRWLTENAQRQKTRLHGQGAKACKGFSNTE